MTLKAAYTELKNVLTGDTGIAAWLELVESDASFTVLKGNREIKRIDVRELPALVLEVGRLPLGVEVHGHHSGGQHEMKLSFVWNEDDEATAFERAAELPELVVKAVMANPTLNSSVDGAWVSNIDPDYGYNHPRHSIAFTVSADMMISR